MYGTCAGLIMLADRITGAIVGQETFGGLDVVVARNAFGSQIDSFETEVVVDGFDGAPVQAIFIRAPLVTAVGPRATTLAALPDDRRGRRRAGEPARHVVPPRGLGRDALPRKIPRPSPRGRVTDGVDSDYISHMAINEWWREHPEERYWMIAPSRGIVGDALSAPKASDDRRFEWSHELVGFTEPGDTLFVWDRTLRDSRASARGAGCSARWARACSSRRRNRDAALADAGQRHAAPGRADLAAVAAADRLARSSRCATRSRRRPKGRCTSRSSDRRTPSRPHPRT